LSVKTGMSERRLRWWAHPTQATTWHKTRTS
jgi:hypothetical protein